MTLQTTIKFVEYLVDGVVIKSHDIDIDSVPLDSVENVAQKISRLSGSLELPLEFSVEGLPGLIVRVCSDFKTMYSIYYYHEAAIFTSLMLPGADPEAEAELIQVFRALLLSDEESEISDDDSDISDEEWELINAEGLFDFNAIEERPVTFQTYLVEPEDGVEGDAGLFEHIHATDRALSIAFLQLPQVQLESESN